MITNLVIQFTNIAFSAVLESAPTLCGPWEVVERRYSPCPKEHVFTVPTTNRPAEFFRVFFPDNGIVPTPESVYAVKMSPTSIAVSASLEFLCDDRQAGPTEFWRSFNTGPWELVRTLSQPAFIDTNLPPGEYVYTARIVGGEFCLFQPVVILP